MTTPEIIVTGAAGLIGSNLVQALNQRGHHDILAVDHLNHPAKEQNLAKLHLAGFMEKQAFREALRAGNIPPSVQSVFHLGACSATTETDAAYLADNNVAYTRELCAWCLAHKIRFIYASSAATYGDGAQGYVDDETVIHTLRPLNLYGESKQTFDLWARESGALAHIAGLKYFNVFGPGEAHKGDMRSVVNKAWHQIRQSGRLELFRSHHPDYADGCQQRDFLWVGDAVAITLFFHDHPEISGLFNAGTGKPHTWLDLAQAIFAALALDPVIDFIDMPLSIRDKYQYFTMADMHKLRRAGFAPAFTPLPQAVAAYINGLQQETESMT